MKNYLIAIMTFAALGCSAGNYLADGMSWNVTVIPAPTGFEEPTVESVQYIDGVATLNNRECYKLYERKGSEEASFLCYLCNSDEQVLFSFDGADDSWRLLYDFAISVGESRDVYSIRSNNRQSTVYCESVDPVEIGGMSFTQITLQELDEYSSLSHITLHWLVGIGSTEGLVDNATFIMDGAGTHILTSVALNQTEIYNASIESVLNDAVAPSVRYKIDGTPFTDADTGIYIENHKKYVRR